MSMHDSQQFDIVQKPGIIVDSFILFDILFMSYQFTRNLAQMYMIYRGHFLSHALVVANL